MTQYYMNITSPIGVKCENIKRYTMMNSTKCPHELQKELERRAGASKDGVLDWSSSDPLCFRCATLINRMNPPAPGSGHEDPGELELPNKWYGECQVACGGKHMCIDKFE